MWLHFYGFVSLYSDVIHSIVKRLHVKSAQTDTKGAADS